jgi:hypothetical protein
MAFAPETLAKVGIAAARARASVVPLSTRARVRLCRCDALVALVLRGAQIGQIGFSAYGEKMLGAGHSFVQSNYAKYLSGARCGFSFNRGAQARDSQARHLNGPPRARRQRAALLLHRQQPLRV